MAKEGDKMHLRKELNRWLYAIILFFSSNIYFFNYSWSGFKFFIIPLYLAFIVICGMIPIANLIMLFIILSKTVYEVKIEDEKIVLNQSRKDQQICKTKYPILLVHGVFFRDLKRILEILKETGAEKVNIIAHSKGGLDSRSAICFEGMDQNVASLTTISCLTKDYCEDFNKKAIDSPLVYYASIGARMRGAYSSFFPLNFSYPMVKHYDGPNDGLVAQNSCSWGATFKLLIPPHFKGISHGDMIDLKRANIRDFDVREFYVQLVSDLREKGF